MKAAIYTRVSTDRQSIEGYSLEAQHDKLIQYIETNKGELFKTYTDPGISAKNLKRPAVQEMISDLKNGLFDTLLVHKLDRLTRNISDLYDLVELFNKHGIKVISHSENIDTSSPMGRMFVYVLGIFAQMYRENLSEEVRKGQSKRAEKGLLSVSVPMFGYQLGETEKLIIKEDEAQWVKWIFEQYIQGKGTTTIAKELNSLGVRRNQGALWDQNKAMSVIENVTYTGKTHWKAANEPEENRIIRQGTHEPIITQEIFNKAQRVLQRRRDGLISLNSYEYVYGGILKCARCGSTMKGKYNKRPGDKLYRGYECSNKERYGSCDQQGISESYVTKLIFEYFEFGLPENFFEEYVPYNDTTDEKKELHKLIAQSESRRTRWQLAYGDGHMPYEDFSKRMSEEMRNLEEWKKQLGGVPEALVSELSNKQAYDMFLKIKEVWASLEQDTRKQLIQSMFQRIVINKNNGKWKIEDILLA
jgi:site-specific DNA recombinase